MKPGTIGKSLQGPSLPIRYYTPAEAQIPVLPAVQKHQPVSIILSYREKKLAQSTESEETKGNEVDGFLLLETTGAEFPEDVKQVYLSNRYLTSVVGEDLTFFSDLIIVDVSENFLPFEPFGALPALQDLRMACNNIKFIGDIIGFDSLMYLDLSYNQFDISSVSRLEGLTNLRELDLCGNNLGGLPQMTNFMKLEKILLEYNRIEDGSVFSALSTVPNLRHVGLANNFLSKIPFDSCATGNMRFLEILDLAFNYFNSEDELEPLTTLPRLVTLMLYGNPVLGPSGEDPMYIYIENLVEIGYQNRNGSNIKDIDFVTEIPRRRILKKGQQLGRLAAYRDFAIKQVDTTISSKSANEWKKIGTQTLFAEAVAATAASKKYSSALSSVPDNNAVLPDFTFITNSIETGDNNYSNRGGGGSADVIADNVMKQVAKEMGLLNSAELIYLRDKAKLPPTAAKIDALFHEDRPAITTLIEEKTAIPDQFYGQKVMATPAATEIVSAQPITLQTAMRALHMAIQQPLTDYEEIYDTKTYNRPTKSSKSWQVPRGSRVSGRADSGPAAYAATQPTAKGNAGAKPDSSAEAAVTAAASPSTKDEDFPDRQRNKYKLPGLPESVAVTQRRARNREHTLGRIDQVLDSLNTHAVAMTTSIPLREMSARETISKYKGFVKPYPAGIKNLMDMVDDVVNEYKNY